MLKQLKDLVNQKKKEFSQNAHSCANTNFEEVEQDAKGLELHKIITELTTLIENVEGTIELDIKDFDGSRLKKDSIITMLDEDGNPIDGETSSIRLVLEDDRYSVRAFEANHTYTTISNDAYASEFRIVEVA